MPHVAGTGSPFKTHFSGPMFGDARDHERNNGLPSMAIPDQSMSIREILQRFASGLTVEQSRVPMYDSGDDGVLDETRPLNWDAMDFAEKVDFVEQHQAKLELLKRDMTAKEQARKKAEDEQKLDQEVEKRLAAKLAAKADPRRDPQDPGPEAK